MRIVICDYSGHPFQIELSRCLAKRGHSVLHLHFAEFQTPKGTMTRQQGDAPSFAVEGIALGQKFEKYRFLRRRFQETRVGKVFANRALAFRPDIVIGCNMPLDAQRQLQQGCKKAGAAFIFWIQDIYSAAIDHYLVERFGSAGWAVGRYYQNMEGLLLRTSEAVVAISERFIEPLLSWQVPRERIDVIENWAPLSEIRPVEKHNEWSRRHGLHDKLVALYTGTLGLKHDPALLLDLARACGARGIHIVVVSEGPAATGLAEEAAMLGVDNLVLLPFQPMEVYSELLGAGDIMLAMLDEDAAGFSVPSKILSYLAAGKPVVAMIAKDNDAAQMIVNAGVGIVAAPGEVTTFIDGVLTLASDSLLRESLGRSGRTFAEKHFAIDAIADRFERMLSGVLARRD